MKKLTTALIFLICFNAFAQEEGNSESLPSDNLYSKSGSIGYSMSGIHQGIYLSQTAEFHSTQKIGFGLGAFMPIYAIPSQLSVTANNFQMNNSWGMNLEIGVGFRITTGKNRRLEFWQHIGPLVTFRGFLATDSNTSQSNLVYIFPAGISMRSSATIYFTEQFGFSVSAGLGVIIDNLGELENGNSVEKGTYDNNKYPYLYIDTNLGFIYRY